MLSIEDNIFTLSRGDYASFSVTPRDENKVPYDMEAGDELVMTIREIASKDSPVLAQIRSRTNVLTFVPEDTRDMNIGKYSADIQLMRCERTPITVYPPFEIGLKEKNWKNFILAAEVTIP